MLTADLQRASFVPDGTLSEGDIVPIVVAMTAHTVIIPKNKRLANRTSPALIIYRDVSEEIEIYRTADPGAKRRLRGHIARQSQSVVEFQVRIGINSQSSPGTLKSDQRGAWVRFGYG